MTLEKIKKRIRIIPFSGQQRTVLGYFDFKGIRTTFVATKDEEGILVSCGAKDRDTIEYVRSSLLETPITEWESYMCHYFLYKEE